MRDMQVAIEKSDYEWVRLLSAESPVAPATSLNVRARATGVIGESATAWGVSVGHRMAGYIMENLTDWMGDRSEEEQHSLRRATEASTLDTLAALVSGDPSHLTASFEPIDNVAWYVQHDIPLQQVVRNVHTGQEFLTQELIDCIPALVPGSGMVSAISRTARDVTNCWSNFISRLTEEYARQHTAWTQSRQGQLAQQVRTVLRGGEVDVPAASRSLDYDLDAAHTGCVLWFEGIDLDLARHLDPTGLAAELARAAMSPAPPLVLSSTSRFINIWFADCAAPVHEAALSVSWPAAFRMATGRTAKGLDGFRLTHREAMAATELARRSSTLPRVVQYSDVELVSMLATDPDRAQVFVHRVLGPLAAPGARAQELRDTLAAWIDSDRSIATTSQALFVHRNTVSYRLRQLEEMLGEDRNNTELRCALLLVGSMPQLLTAPSSQS